MTNGQSFFDTFCKKKPLAVLSASASAIPSSSAFPSRSVSFPASATALSSEVPYKPVPTAPVSKGAPGYPNPFVKSADGSVFGFFPESHSDLAVLAIPNYGPAPPSNNIDFEDVVRELLATAKAHGKKKLIIDLRGNPGGTVPLAIDTFHQLFPSMTPYGAGNYRAHPLFNFTGEIVSSYYAEVNSKKKTAGKVLHDNLEGTPLNYRQLLTATNKDYSSWADFYGPKYIHGDNYTTLTQFNYSDPAWEAQGDPVYGYGSDDAPQPQTFEAENIVLLQDGVCASTCTIFTELMKSQAHVKQIVVGGRKQTGPMQGVGGVKGANIQGMATLLDFVVAAYLQATRTQQAYLESALGMSGASFVRAATHALDRAAGGGEFMVQATVNFRNNIRQGDDTTTPLQFVYEAADCRFFYTAAMYADQELLWDKTYDLAWNGGACVAGSTDQASAGFGDGYITSPAPDGAASNNTIFPSSDLGRAVSPSATSGYVPSSTASSTGTGTASSANQSGAAMARPKSVSVAGLVGAIAVSMLLA